MVNSSFLALEINPVVDGAAGARDAVSVAARASGDDSLWLTSQRLHGAGLDSDVSSQGSHRQHGFTQAPLTLWPTYTLCYWHSVKYPILILSRLNNR